MKGKRKSGRLSIRIEGDLEKALKIKAAAANRDFADYVRIVLSDHVRPKKRAA